MFQDRHPKNWEKQTILKENKAGEIPVSAFQAYYKARVSKTDTKRDQ